MPEYLSRLQTVVRYVVNKNHNRFSSQAYLSIQPVMQNMVMSNKGRDVCNNGAWTRDLHPHISLPVADVHAYTNQMHQSEDHTSCERFSGSQRKSISAGVIVAPWGRHTLTNYLSLGTCFYMRYSINLFQH